MATVVTDQDLADAIDDLVNKLAALSDAAEDPVFAEAAAVGEQILQLGVSITDTVLGCVFG